jgi:hypothetical protein
VNRIYFSIAFVIVLALLLSAGSGYMLLGTAGQPDAGAAMSGGLTLVGGFWGGAGPASAPARYPIYLPVVMCP